MAASATEQGRIGSIVAGRYRLLRVLGRGGMGVVYEAEHTPNKRRVAIKIMHPENQLNEENVKRFLNEGANAGRVKHPNVVEFIEMGQDTSDGSLFIVLELLRGTDLSSYLVRYGRIEPREAILVASQVLQALAVAHAAEIVHRDVKPENIFLTPGPDGETHVKIVDFGISKAINPEKAFVGSITQINTTVGTPHYMSPEQARGEPIDPRADLWALGVVLYESLTGHLPFDGDNFNTQIVAVVTEAHVPASTYGVDRELSAIIDVCLQKDRTRRYANAAAMLDALRRYAASTPALAIDPSLFSDAPPFEARTSEWRAAPVTSGVKGIPSAISSSERRPLGDGAALESTPVFPGMVRFDEDAQADNAPTAVRPLDRSFVRATPAADPVAVAPASAPPIDDDDGLPRTWVLVTLALLTAIITGASTYVVYRHVRPAAFMSASVRLVFSPLPRGARIVINGHDRGTSAAQTVVRSTQPIRVRIEAPGFHALEFNLTPSNDQNVQLPALAPAPRASAPPPPPVHAPPAAATPLPSIPVDAALAAPLAPTPVPPMAAQARVAPARAPEPTMGSLRIGGAGCVISVDGTRIGPAPVVGYSVGLGRHFVTCQRNGAESTQTVQVMGREPTVVLF